MSTEMIIELVGYVGSALVLVSFLMSSVIRLRVINTIGAVIYVIYAMIIHSYPTALMNVVLVGINIYYLVQLKKDDRHFELVEGKTDEHFLAHFLKYYKEDMKACFPGLDLEARGNRAYMVCCDATPAGVLLGNAKEDGTFEVLLDYSTPTYRDCSVGKFLYGKLAESGFKRMVFAGEPGKHEDYLQKMGFVKEDGRYTKKL